MTSYPENTLLIWAHPSLTHDALDHVANHRLVRAVQDNLAQVLSATEIGSLSLPYLYLVLQQALILYSGLISDCCKVK